MISWSEIDTVLLDMDGTLLDLHFDDYFWQVQLPLKWGELNGWDSETAMSKLIPIFQGTRGTLPWYCLDYWSEQIGMDVFEVKTGIEHLIKIRPFVNEFLGFLRQEKKSVVLVTNSHDKFIDLKMQQTDIQHYFSEIHSSHSYGVAKEQVQFWFKLGEKLSYDVSSTLLIDDNLSVLRSAREHGIAHLLGIAKPSSERPEIDSEEFTAVTSFKDLLP